MFEQPDHVILQPAVGEVADRILHFDMLHIDNHKSASAESNVIQELVIVLFVHAKPDRHDGGRRQAADQMYIPARDLIVDDDGAEIADIVIQRINLEQYLQIRRERVDRIEHRRDVHQHHRNDAVNILHILKEDIKRRKNESNADIEHDQTDDRIDQKQELPGKSHAVDRREYEEHNHRQPEIDQRRHVLGDQKQRLWDVDMRNDVRVVHQRAHALRRALAEIGEDHDARKKIDRIMRHIPAEEMAENKIEHQKLHQRRQHAPQHAQRRALIALFEVALHQFFKQKLISVQDLFHGCVLTPSLLFLRRPFRGSEYRVTL